MSTQNNANILWFLPTHGDGRYLGTTTGGREVNFNYLRQIAQAADQLGYFGVLLPTGRSCEDSWVVASAVPPMFEILIGCSFVRSEESDDTEPSALTGQP